MQGVDEVIAKAKGTRGRKNAEKQEAVCKPDVLEKKLKELIRLHIAAKEAATDESEAIKAAAEASGYNASNIRALVVANAGDNFSDKKRNVDQQYELFDEIGEVGKK